MTRQLNTFGHVSIYFLHDAGNPGSSTSHLGNLDLQLPAEHLPAIQSSAPSGDSEQRASTFVPTRRNTRCVELFSGGRAAERHPAGLSRSPRESARGGPAPSARRPALWIRRTQKVAIDWRQTLAEDAW